MNELLACVVGFFGIPAFVLLMHYLPRTTGVFVFTCITYLAWVAAHRGEPVQSALVFCAGVWIAARHCNLHRHFCVSTRTTAEQ